MISSSREGREKSKRAGGSPAPAAGPRSRLLVWLVYIGLAVGTLAIYGQVHDFQFVSWDDKLFVSENPQVAGGLTWDNFIWSLGIHGPAHWHPLAWWSHQLNCQLFGLEPGSHHVVSVVLHVAAALMLLTAFWRLSGDFWPSALVAALFALHPVSVESVAWVSHLRDPLSTLFWALVLWSYAGYARRGGSWRYLLVLLFFALGLMAKPMLVTLPCVLLLLDYWPLKRVKFGAWSPEHGAARANPESEIRRRAIGWLLLEKAPLLALTGVSIWLSYLCQHTARAIVSLESHPLGPRLANTAQTYVLHLRNMLWPTKLSPIYPFPESFHTPLVAGAVVFLLALTAASIYFGRRRGYLLVGWLWYLGTLVPVIGLLKMGAPVSMTDHHAYVPLLGIYVALAWTLAGWVRRHPALRPAVIGAVAVVLLGLLPLTWRQAAVWRDNVSLYEHTLAVTRNNWLAHNNLGHALQEQGKIVEAIEHYHQTLRIKPDYAKAHNNLGLALQEQGKMAEAIEHYRQALWIEPDFAIAHNNLGTALRGQGEIAEAIEHYHHALRIEPDFAIAHNNMGNALLGQGKIVEAIDRYHQALRIEPDYVEAHTSLGVALQEQGKIVKAIEHFHQALRIKPDYAEAHNSLGFAIHVQGDIPAAVRHYTRALDLNPDLPLALNHLAWIRATHPDTVLRDGTQAVELAERSCELTGHQVANALDTLAAAYAEAGRFGEATRTASNAIDAATDAGDEKLAREIRGRVELYRQGVPYREPSE